jgi:MFS family permease
MESPRTTVPRLPARDWVRLAQGFYFIFWGLLVAALVGAQLFLIVAFRAVAELFLIGGALATLVGTVRLHQAASLGPHWRRQTRRILMLAVLFAYFSVFFCLWRRVPTSLYLMANALGFVMAGILYLILLSRTVAVMGLAVGGASLVQESRVYGASSITLLLLPFLAFLLYVSVIVMREDRDVFGVLQFVFDHLNLLVPILVLLPFSLTMSLVWSAKDTALRWLCDADDADRTPSAQ